MSQIIRPQIWTSHISFNTIWSANIGVANRLSPPQKKIRCTIPSSYTPSGLRCTLLSSVFPAELQRTLLNYTALFPELRVPSIILCLKSPTVRHLASPHRSGKKCWCWNQSGTGLGWWMPIASTSMPMLSYAIYASLRASRLLSASVTFLCLCCCCCQSCCCNVIAVVGLPAVLCNLLLASPDTGELLLPY